MCKRKHLLSAIFAFSGLRHLQHALHWREPPNKTGVASGTLQVLLLLSRLQVFIHTFSYIFLQHFSPTMTWSQHSGTAGKHLMSFPHLGHQRNYCQHWRFSETTVFCSNYMLENIKILLADENIELFLVVEKSIHAALGRHDYATAVSLHVKDQVSPLFFRWCVAKIVKCLQYSEASWASWPGAAPAGSEPSKFFTMHSVEACLCWYGLPSLIQLAYVTKKKINKRTVVFNGCPPLLVRRWNG